MNKIVSFEELFELVSDKDSAITKAKKQGRLAYISGNKLSDNPYMTRKYMAHKSLWDIGYGESKEIITSKLNGNNTI